MKNSVSLTAIVFYPGVLTLWLQHSKQRINVNYLNISKKNCDILQKKGVFPYSFLDSFEKLSEKSFPQYGDQWINSLFGQIDVSEEGVQHTNKVWNMFGCKNFGDYLML